MAQQLNTLDYIRIIRSPGEEYEWVIDGFVISPPQPDGLGNGMQVMLNIPVELTECRELYGDYRSVVPCHHVDYDFEPDLLGSQYGENPKFVKCAARIYFFGENDIVEVLAKFEV